MNITVNKRINEKSIKNIHYTNNSNTLIFFLILKTLGFDFYLL